MSQPLRSLIAGIAFAGFCTTPMAATHWVCALSDDVVRLVCVADTGPELPTSATKGISHVRGTRFPLDTADIYTVELGVPPWSPTGWRCWRDPPSVFAPRTAPCPWHRCPAGTPSRQDGARRPCADTSGIITSNTDMA
jgi:hypothetical protein